MRVGEKKRSVEKLRKKNHSRSKSPEDELFEFQKATSIRAPFTQPYSKNCELVEPTVGVASSTYFP